LKRQVGNFPQGFSHLSLVQTVLGLHHQEPLRDKIAPGNHDQDRGARN
jgi:hypothetical protein